MDLEAQTGKEKGGYLNRKEKIVHIEFITGSKEKSKLLQELLLQDKKLENSQSVLLLHKK